METYETYEILQRTRVAVRAGRLASYWPANFHPYPLGRVRLGLVQTQAQWVWDGSVLDGPVVVIEGQTPVWRTEVQDGWLMAQALWRLGVTDKERLELLQALPGALIAAACAAGRSRDDIIDQMGAGRRTRPRPTWESLEQWSVERAREGWDLVESWQYGGEGNPCALFLLRKSGPALRLVE